jgi:hypothetical protein
VSSPEYLYKYRSLSPQDTRDRTLDIIQRNRIFFASPTSFNDPFESNFVLRVSATPEQRINYWANGFIRGGETKESADALAKTYDDEFTKTPNEYHEVELRKTLEQGISEGVALLSLSAKPDDLLMWAHYASSHTGVCLKFALSADQPFFAEAEPVEYQRDYPEFNYFTSPSNEKLVKALLTKSEHWGYEEEYRKIEPGGEPGLRSFHPSLLAGVILGARISDLDRKEIGALVKDRAPLYQAELDRSRFRINIVAN